MAMRTIFVPFYQVVCDQCEVEGPRFMTKEIILRIAREHDWRQDPDHPDNFLCPTCARIQEEELQAQDYRDELAHALRVEAGMG